MDDAIGQRFAVVGNPALLEGLETSAMLLPGVGVDWLAQHGARAAILRPDRYIYAVVRDRQELVAATSRTATPFGSLWSGSSRS
jgi:3-(3-hydroxy-phenyl)propionate hydroxylase